MNLVFPFDHDHHLPWDRVRRLLGGKGAGLNWMCSHDILKERVPPGFTITSDAYRRYTDHEGIDDGLAVEIRAALADLEERTGERLGDPVRPLIVSIRGGAPVSMPGQLETVLNVGITGVVVKHLAHESSAWAWDCHRAFLEGYARAAVGLDRTALDEIARSATNRSDAELTGQNMKAINLELARRLAEIHPFVADDHEALLFELVAAVFESWNSEHARRFRQSPRERIPDDLGTAVNVQRMVFGNRDDCSGAGVFFTRNKDTGAIAPSAEYARGRQGEAIVSGTTNADEDTLDQLRELGAWDELVTTGEILEEMFEDACDIEFTIDNGRLWLLQVRPAARSGQAALQIAVDLATQPHRRGKTLLNQDDTLLQLKADDVARVLYDRLIPAPADEGRLLARGDNGAYGAAFGGAVFTKRAALQATEPAVLIRPETVPEDTQAMERAVGYVTTIGGRFSHAALVATKWGKPAVVGVEGLTIDPDGNWCEFPSVNGGPPQRVYAGQPLSIDGSTGEVYSGQVAFERAGASANLQKICDWSKSVCDRERGATVGVRVNAETPDMIAQGLGYGAAGVGMVRTERMRSVPEALGALAPALRSRAGEVPEEVLSQLHSCHVREFRLLFAECRKHEVPLGLRLLDTAVFGDRAPAPEADMQPPDVEGDEDRFADLLAATLNGTNTARVVSQRVSPLSTRGVRLGVLMTELYRLQVDAMFAVASEHLSDGHVPAVELIIPMVIATGEVAFIKELVESERAAHLKRARDGDNLALVHALERWQPRIGVMLETPRAILIADRLTELVDFFALGTNDLTQMVYGFDSEEVGGPLLQAYFDRQILTINPFDSLDDKAVLPLITLGIERIRHAAGDQYVEIGVVGDHGGDARSIEMLARAGVDYVSCRTDRVPVAMLSAAQVAIRAARHNSAKPLAIAERATA